MHLRRPIFRPNGNIFRNLFVRRSTCSRPRRSPAPSRDIELMLPKVHPNRLDSQAESAVHNLFLLTITNLMLYVKKLSQTYFRIAQIISAVENMLLNKFRNMPRHVGMTVHCPFILQVIITDVLPFSNW